MKEAHSDDIQEGDIVDMMAEIPHLPSIIDLTVEVDAYGHAIGASLAKLIAKCTNIEHHSVCMYSSRVRPAVRMTLSFNTMKIGSGLIYLGLIYNCMQGEECLDLSCICHHQSTDWDSQKLSLEHLRSIEIRGIARQPDTSGAAVAHTRNSTREDDCRLRYASHLEDGEEVDFDIVPCYGGRWLPSVWKCSELGLFVRPVEYEWMQDMEIRVHKGTGEA